MNIEKICEYFNDIGILQIENINKFLNIYSQFSRNKYKSKADKLILTLFSYLTSISKNEQNLYNISKNIVNNFTNNQLLYRYHALTMFNNIFNTKLRLNYILFMYKLRTHIFNKKLKNINHTINPYSKVSISNLEKENEFKKIGNYTSLFKGQNNNINKPKKVTKIIKKNNIIKVNNYGYISDNEKECTFSPTINLKYKSKYKSKNEFNNFNTKNNNINNINYESIQHSTYNDDKDNINDNSFNKFIPFKNSINYGFNNKINKEIEKMILNISKFSNNPNNSKYLTKKTKNKKEINNIIPSNSYQEINNNYNFYQNEKEYIKKVQDKIFQLKMKQMDKMSKECTFSPEINKNSRYLNLIKNKRNDEDENNNIINNYNIIQRNNIDINRNNNYNSYINYKNSTSLNTDTKKSTLKDKNSKNNKEYIDEYYNIYPNKLNRNHNFKINEKQKAHSYSNTKRKYNDNNNEYSIYRMRKEELSKLFKEQYPFMPSIKYNKKFPVKSSFDERQKKFIQNKEKLNKLKEEQEQKQLEEFQKMNIRPKSNSKEVVKRLYDNEAIKIKDRLKKEKEEKLKKKNVINWDKRKKKYKEKYPDDFNSMIIRNKKLNNTHNNSHEKDIINNNFVEMNTYNNDKGFKNNENMGIMNKELMNKNKKLLMDKIKDEHVIGFKNNNYQNITKNNNIIKNNNNLENDENHNFDIIEGNNNENIKESNKNSINIENRISNEDEEIFDLEEKMKKFENDNLLKDLNNKDGIKSSTFQEMMNKLNN